MSPKIRKVAIPIVILLVGVIGFIIMILLKSEPEKKAIETKAFLVDTKPILVEDLEFLVYAQGAVQAKNRTILSTQVSGRVVSIAKFFTEGGFFNNGDVLVELESDDYQTDLLLAQAELARVQASLDEEVARSAVAEREWSSVNSGKPPELGLRKPQLAREQANLKAAKASLERAKRNLSRTKITAPYDGLVKARLIDLGQFVSMGAQIGEVYSTDVAEIRLALTDNDLAFLDDINSVQPQVTLSADIAGKKHFWQGRLVRDEAVLDESRRVIYGVVEIQDPYNLKTPRHPTKLKFGRFVSAAISGLLANDIVKLPRYVMRLDGTVLTVNPDNKININNVDVMRVDEDFVYISGGLPLQDKVVMSAISTPYSGMPVRFTENEPTKPRDKEIEQSAKVKL